VGETFHSAVRRLDYLQFKPPVNPSYYRAA